MITEKLKKVYEEKNILSEKEFLTQIIDLYKEYSETTVNENYKNLLILIGEKGIYTFKELKNHYLKKFPHFQEDVQFYYDKLKRDEYIKEMSVCIDQLNLYARGFILTKKGLDKLKEIDAQKEWKHLTKEQFNKKNFRKYVYYRLLDKGIKWKKVKTGIYSFNNQEGIDDGLCFLIQNKKDISEALEFIENQTEYHNIYFINCNLKVQKNIFLVNLYFWFNQRVKDKKQTGLNINYIRLENLEKEEINWNKKHLYTPKIKSISV